MERAEAFDIRSQVSCPKGASPGLARRDISHAQSQMIETAVKNRSSKRTCLTKAECNFRTLLAMRAIPVSS